MQFKLGELFSGAGGLGYAATTARIAHYEDTFIINHAWATDYNSDACYSYANNIVNVFHEYENDIFSNEKRSVICEDIRRLDFNELSEIDALAFGFPCNDFSLVGEQKGTEGNFGGLYTYCVTALKRFKPMWFVAENVGGLKSSNEGQAFATILNELKNSGYTLTPHLYKFEEYGVPQARHRIIIVGIRNDLKFKFAVPCESPYKQLDNSAKNAIENPPITSKAFNHEIPIHSKNVIERLKYIKAGENAFNAKLPPELQLNVKGAKISQIYKRLHPNKPSYTVTGSGGGGTHVYHWSENRALTNRERARLQTFPDNFIFYGSKESVRKQIGMAVPPQGAKIIFEAILKSFAKISYESKPQNIDF
jgi:DNA (cytosine-5)-methyltransferase 1